MSHNPASASRPTTDIVADLRDFGDTLARNDHPEGAKLQREATDRLAELDAELTSTKFWHAATVEQLRKVEQRGWSDRIDALRPPCPTCGGHTLVGAEGNTYDLNDGQPCPDCVDGKVPIERLVALWNAVEQCHADGSPTIFTEHLRGIR